MTRSLILTRGCDKLKKIDNGLPLEAISSIIGHT